MGLCESGLILFIKRQGLERSVTNYSVMWFYNCYANVWWQIFGAQRYFVPITEFVKSELNHSLRHSGVKNADEAELRQVASEPVDLNVYNVNDFPLLSKLVARLVHILCGRIEERGISKRKLSFLIDNMPVCL